MTNASNREIGRRIAALRKQRGWSQSALASLTQPKLDQSVLSRIEAGKREITVSEVDKLARALGVEPGALLEGLDEGPAREAAASERRAALHERAAFRRSAPSRSYGATDAMDDDSAFDGDEGADVLFDTLSAAVVQSPAARVDDLTRAKLDARRARLRRREDGAADAGLAVSAELSAFPDSLERTRHLLRRDATARAGERARSVAPGPPPTRTLSLPAPMLSVIADYLRLQAMVEDEAPPWSASWHSVDSHGRRRPAGKPSGWSAGRPAAAVSWHEPRDRYARLWRHELGIGVDGPVPDLVALFEDTGVAEVVVARLETDEPVCANVTVPGGAEDVSFLFVNANRPVTLQRHALVHAFGHLALGHGDVVDQRIEWSRATPLEMEANDFAEEFLAPTAAVARWYDRHGDPRPTVDLLLELGAAFGITFWAAYYRSRAAGRLGEKPQAKLMHELRARQWELLPEQSFRGGLRDTLSTLSEETPLPPAAAVGVGGVPPRLTRAAGASAVLRVPARLRVWTLQALRGGRLSLEQAAAVLRRSPADLAAELERLGLE
jgi:Zn-dependent peptidase ImmA (M78 family)/transcriptional regulator with XRE-family HTH domain